MMKRNLKKARQRLDKRLSEFKPEDRFAVPPRGWVRAIRDALGMTASQLGQRLGMKPQSILNLEKSEVQDSVQLKTLRRAAEALDCTLVYAMIPNSSLEEMSNEQAKAIAKRELTRIGHSMDLEAQGLSKEEREEMINDFIEEHLTDRDLWNLND